MKKILTFFLVMLTFQAFSQEINITGTIKDDKGSPLIGVTVLIKNGTKGAITDFDGGYKLKAKKGDVLVFSYLGMETKEVTLNEQSVVNLVLKEMDTTLDNIVVIGYGTVKKSDLTGSVSSIKAEDITRQGTVALDQALAGRAAGVVVTQSSGAPGSGSSITIRGISSLSSSQPLYVIDGIPIDNSSEDALNEDTQAGGNISPLSLINPSDIQSVEILKDASATAIYGSRGANGVVLITTKGGKEGKGVVEITHESMIGVLPQFLHLLDANEYWISRNEAQINGGGGPIATTVLDSARAGLIPSQNWQDVVYRNAFSTNTNASFSGGNKDLRYMVSGNLLDSDGIIKKTDFNRAQTRLNLNATISDKLSMGTRMNYSVINSSTQSTGTSLIDNNGTNSIVRKTLSSRPSDIFLDIDNPDNDSEENNRLNPLIILENNTWDTTQNQFLGSAYFNLKLGTKFVVKSTLTYQNRFNKQRFYQNDLEALGLDLTNDRNGWARLKDTQTLATTNTNQITYSKKSKKNKFDIVLGQSLEWRQSESLAISNFGFPNDLLTYFAPNSAAFSEPDVVTFRDSKLSSFFGRINYSFKKKFLFTLTGRYDGSSKFAANNKWAFFPAGSIAYKLEKEKFIKKIAAISTAKIRLSYGKVGNQAVREYQSLSQLESDQFVFGTGSGEALSQTFSTAQLANQNLKWETTTQFDAGLDLGLFKNKFNITADYYNKQTNDLLVAKSSIPAQSGFTTIAENFGDIETNGFELDLNFFMVNSDKFKWKVAGNISKSKATVTSLRSDEVQSGVTFGQVSTGTQRLIIGEEVGTFWGWKRAGISQFDDFVEFQGRTTQEQIDLYNVDRTATYTYVDGYEGGYPVNNTVHRPGEQLYEDGDGDLIITEADKGKIGSSQPDIILGLVNNFTIGNFDVSFSMDAQYGRDVANITNFALLEYDNGQQLQEVTKAWTPENQSTSRPKVSTNNGSTAVQFSDRYIEDASFLRLQNVTIGYNLPNVYTSKLKIQSLRLYVSGSNLFTITDYSGYNPDVNLGGNNNLSLGHDNSGYPLASLFRVGATLRF